MSILTRIGERRMLETAIESSIPLALAVVSYLYTAYALSEPTAGRPLYDLEVFLSLSLPTLLLSWAFSRVSYLAGVVYPWKSTLISLGATLLLLALVPWITSYNYQVRCRGLEGRLLPVRTFTDVSVPDVRADATGHLDSVCQLEQQVPTAFRPGPLLRPTWRGFSQMLPFGIYGLAFLSILASVGLRDRRLIRTRLAHFLWHELRLQTAAGAESAFVYRDETGAKIGRWTACANPTIWGEVCGQLYPATHRFVEGEACVRCSLVFKPSPMLTLTVVALRHGDLDFLNNLESREARIWRQSEPQPRQAETADARWASLGEITLPDVLSVAQSLSLILDWLDKLQPEDPGQARAKELALRQASRLAAWCWFSEDAPSLKGSIPTRDVLLAIGAQRLRDLYGGRSGWKALQLDTGLLPIDLRLGLWKPPESWMADASTPQKGQRFNNRQVYWIPVSRVAFSAEPDGLWVPRVEGAGLRAWLTLTSRNAWFQPAPYHWEGAPWAELVHFDAPHDLDHVPLSLVRIPAPEEEAITQEAQLGCRLSEWDWLDRRHLELLRRQAVFMAPYDMKLWNPDTVRRGVAGAAISRE